jgi:2-succinyl-6-hydroxy-2,4-cyclohexadiene-1-carboxylate synthase
LLLHGFTGSAATWAELAGRWITGHRLIVPDLLGHGRSDAPRDPARYALERQAEDLAELLDSLGACPADVAGYSMGARLALQLALGHPRSVHSLVLESPSAGIADAGERARRRATDERLARQLEEDGLAAFVDAWEAQALFDSHARLLPDARARLRAERLGHDPGGLAASLRGAGQGAMTPLRDRLRDIACPVLVVAGELDPSGLERAEAVAGAIPRGRLEVVAGAGHTPHLEQPDDFFRLASQHLALTSDRSY